MALELTIVTPEGEVFSDPVDRVVFPGTEGEFGVLEGHERFLTPLKIGALEIQQGGTTRYAAISGGFADVGGSQVVALVDTCELADGIDLPRAEAARDRAQAALEKLPPNEAEEASYQLQERALQRALIRIQVAARGH
ncbi:MAG: F0F1 ATP synthase subunit epsilon [Myxococcales bacterium]|nr:F0F1 ATP synthase subunit epsilon [Myxococcales bacterium]